MSRERNEQGQFVGTFTDGAVLDAVRGVAPAPATANDVADALDCTRKAAWQRLTALHDEGRVERRKVGGRAVVWWLTDEADADPEARLKRLSNDLGEPIAVGEQVYESGDAHTLDSTEGAYPDDRTAVEERDAEDIIEVLEAFIEEGDAPESPIPSTETVRDDYHAHRHRENVEHLAREGE